MFEASLKLRTGLVVSNRQKNLTILYCMQTLNNNILVCFQVPQQQQVRQQAPPQQQQGQQQPRAAHNHNHGGQPQVLHKDIKHEAE